LRETAAGNNLTMLRGRIPASSLSASLVLYARGGRRLRRRERNSKKRDRQMSSGSVVSTGEPTKSLVGQREE
jgi:hypothetical protein